MQTRNDSHYRQEFENSPARMTDRARGSFLLVILIIALGACASPQSDPGISIVVSTSILGDVVVQVAGDEATVEVLMPIGSSPHDFSPSAQQVASITRADLVIVNGLGLEEALLDVTEAAQRDGVVILELGPQLDPVPLADSDHLDPHVWLDPVRMATAVELVANALTGVAPNGAWSARAADYQATLADLDEEIGTLIGGIPPGRRTMVTNHDSLGYFARRYDLQVVGTVIPGGSSLSAPSAADLADLIAVIEETGTNAIFAETTEPDRLAETVAGDLDRPVAVVTLYTGSLGATGTAADSYVGMMRTDAELIASALGQGET